MRTKAAWLIAVCLAVHWSPSLAEEAPLSVYHYTPCEALWIDGGHHIGLLVDGKYRCGRISPIAFPPLNDAELDGVVQQLKSEGYLDRGFPDARARAILHRFDGCVGIEPWEAVSNPVHSALLKCWFYRKAQGLPPQVYLWLSIAGADAIYLDESNAPRWSGGGTKDLALYTYSIDRVSEEDHSTFDPLGFVAFRIATERGMCLTRDDWPSHYTIPGQPWIHFVCSDTTSSSRLSVGQWFVANSPYAVRVEFNQKNSEDAGWAYADGSRAPYDSFAMDDRGRITFALEITQSQPEESDLSTLVRLVNGQCLAIYLDRGSSGGISALWFSFSAAGIDALRSRAGFD